MTGVGEEGGETMDPLLTAGLKVASSKEGEGGVKNKKKDWRARGVRSSWGNFLFGFIEG